ncbi:hypothetical protein L2E82_17394 [Cichorium intybus]|uniref:Uncharacterized protein n=1 Tax=Cichorium intybus TaxID=13427 RepID=A0ACB9F877_CICIN|nr:hypothetical protein L2E82_17394 [Cichorium intybus]
MQGLEFASRSINADAMGKHSISIMSVPIAARVAKVSKMSSQGNGDLAHDWLQSSRYISATARPRLEEPMTKFKRRKILPSQPSIGMPEMVCRKPAGVSRNILYGLEHHENEECIDDIFPFGRPAALLQCGGI